MSCPGLHCPGCSEGQSLGILGTVAVAVIIADETVRWAADRIWWIGGTAAACFALSVAVTMWLERRADARGVRYAELHGIASRADVEELTPAGVAWLASREQPRAALGVREVHFHFGGLSADEQAHIIRTTLAGHPAPGPEEITR
ncbi:MAG TPA: hypothetical protein VFB06_11255 [Streptosporangiaceae bacterium]|nr:hypothetical protein [Streptosporangiaceae bacterium]